MFCPYFVSKNSWEKNFLARLPFYGLNDCRAKYPSSWSRSLARLYRPSGRGEELFLQCEMGSIFVALLN